MSIGLLAVPGGSAEWLIALRQCDTESFLESPVWLDLQDILGIELRYRVPKASFRQRRRTPHAPCIGSRDSMSPTTLLFLLSHCSLRRLATGVLSTSYDCPGRGDAPRRVTLPEFGSWGKNEVR